jgi:hypothetical protein
MVDYGLFWIPNPSSPVAANISKFLGLRNCTGSGGAGDASESTFVNLERTINQTSYTAVRDRPAAVAIETKTPVSSGGSVDGRDPYVQLGVWNLAWLKRVRTLLGIFDDMDKSGSAVACPATISLPMLTIQGSEWHLSFLCDTKSLPKLDIGGNSNNSQRDITLADISQQSSAVIFDFPAPIGCTDSTLECYKLLVNLRRIGQWVVGDFAPWWEEYVGGAIARRLHVAVNT